MNTSPRRARSAWWVWIVGIVAVAVVLWRFGQPAVGPFQGERAPHFSVVDLNDETVELASLQDKPVLINFWATWCLPCLEEMPEIQSVYEEFGHAFHVMAISDEPKNTVKRYLEDFSYTFPIYLDPGGDVGRTYLIQAMPTTLFIDEHGVIQTRHIGQLSGEQLRQYLGELITIQ